MKELDAQSVLLAGGWDLRYAVTLAIAVNGDVAVALIDSNGDQADIDLDEYERDADGDWQEGGSGSAGDEGAAWSSAMAAAWGRGEPEEIIHVEYRGVRHPVVASDSGWWAFVTPVVDDSDTCPRQVR